MPEADVADGQQREDRQSADPHSVVYAGGMVGPFDRVIACRDVESSLMSAFGIPSMLHGIPFGLTLITHRAREWAFSEMGSA